MIGEEHSHLEGLLKHLVRLNGQVASGVGLLHNRFVD